MNPHMVNRDSQDPVKLPQPSNASFDVVLRDALRAMETPPIPSDFAAHMEIHATRAPVSRARHGGQETLDRFVTITLVLGLVLAGCAYVWPQLLGIASTFGLEISQVAQSAVDQPLSQVAQSALDQPLRSWLSMPWVQASLLALLLPVFVDFGRDRALDSRK
jgi:hypothetical protein